MVKCRLITEEIEDSFCGKDICCHHCDEKETCNVSCNQLEDCEEQIHEKDELQVMEEALPDQITQIADLVIQMKKMEETVSKFKEDLLKAMEQHGIKSFTIGKVFFTYVAPTTRTTFDKKALQKEHPELDLSKYNKVSDVKASVRIKVK